MSDRAAAARLRRDLLRFLESLGLDPRAHALAAERLWRLVSAGSAADLTGDSDSFIEQTLARWVARACGIELGSGPLAASRAVAALLLSDVLERWPDFFLAPVEELPSQMRRALAEAAPFAQPLPLPGVMPEQRLDVLPSEIFRPRRALIAARRG